MRKPPTWRQMMVLFAVSAAITAALTACFMAIL